MNVDVMLQHSIYCDYPVWRKNIYANRDRFKQIILYPSDHNRELSLKDFLYQVIPETWCTPVEIDWSTADWRQVECEPMLAYSDAEWIYFTEQDWFVKDYAKFYDDVEREMKNGADAIGWWNPTNFPYLHPSCFFIKREALDKTQKDFRAHPEINGCDHFAMLTRDLEKNGAKIVTLQSMGYKEWDDCFHLGGLTSNYIDALLYKDKYEFHRPEIFANHLLLATQVPVPQSPDFIEMSNQVKDIFNKRYPDFQYDLKWDRYFQ